MTRRRQATRRARYTAADFLLHDGWTDGYILDATPLLPSQKDAAAEWERLRTETWQTWALDAVSSPPVAAAHFDGIDDEDSVAAFRARRPRAAAAITAELDQYLALRSRRLDEMHDLTPSPLTPQEAERGDPTGVGIRRDGRGRPAGTGLLPAGRPPSQPPAAPAAPTES